MLFIFRWFDNTEHSEQNICLRLTGRCKAPYTQRRFYDTGIHLCEERAKIHRFKDPFERTEEGGWAQAPGQTLESLMIKELDFLALLPVTLAMSLQPFVLFHTQELCAHPNPIRSAAGVHFLIIVLWTELLIHLCSLAIINALLIVLFWSFAAVKMDDQTLAVNAVNFLRYVLVLAEHIGAKPEWTADWVSATEVSMSSCSRVRETVKQDEARSSSALLLTVQVYSRPRLQHPEERTLRSLHAPQHKENVSSTYYPHFDCITHIMYMWNSNTPGYSPVLKSSGELKCQDQEV